MNELVTKFNMIDTLCIWKYNVYFTDHSTTHLYFRFEIPKGYSEAVTRTRNDMAMYMQCDRTPLIKRDAIFHVFSDLMF